MADELIDKILRFSFFAFLGIVLIGIGLGLLYFLYLESASKYNAALSAEGKEVPAKIVEKNITRHSPSSKTVSYEFTLEFIAERELQRQTITVEKEEYEKFQKGADFVIRFHPSNPSYIVTEQDQRSRLFLKLLIGGLSVIGCLIIIVQTFSLYSFFQKRSEKL